MSQAHDSPAEDDDDGRTGPPAIFLAVAAVCVVVGLALLLVGSFGAHVAGYVCASFLPIVAVGLFRRIDFTRRLSSRYRPRPELRRAIPVVLVAAFLVSGIHVWAIATEMAS